jgi:GntP family gluconate:H+ symporter
MCYILAYVIFVPIAKELAARLDNPPISTATALALGAVASFNFVYPSPVIISATEELSANADRFSILGFLIAIPTSIAGYLYARKLEQTEPEITRVGEKGIETRDINIKIYKNAADELRRLEAYSPIFFPLLLILLQAGFEHLHPMLAFLGNPNIASLQELFSPSFPAESSGYCTKGTG